MNDKSWKRQDLSQDRDHLVVTKTETQDLCTKTKSFFQVLESPRDQDHVLEDYITALAALTLYHSFAQENLVQSPEQTQDSIHPG